MHKCFWIVKIPKNYFCSSLMLRYSVTPDPHSHLLRLSLEFEPSRHTVSFHMPAWTSGSYLIRDYAGRIRGPRTTTGKLNQIDKNHWTLSGLTPGSTIRIYWDVFAYSPGIHDAWIDDYRGFFNPAAVLLIPEGHDGPCSLNFSDGTFVPHCSMEAVSDRTFAASDLQELLDTPVTFTNETVEHSIHNLTIKGIPHKLVFTGPGVSSLNTDFILHDVEAILRATFEFWGAVPFKHYIFHIQTGPHLYGGLEHESSCVLQTDAFALPSTGETSRSEGYEDFLTLLAHEYFHAWLVKFLRPSVFLPYSLDRESHTHDLWIFEGFTTYYENLLPLRAGIIDRDQFLSLTSARFNRVRERNGFFAESLSDASFNAWTHLYKQTPDSAYSQTSYYGKGAILAFMLDAALRNSGLSLDSILKDWFRNALANPNLRKLDDGAFFERIPIAPIAQRFKKLVETTDRFLWEVEWSNSLAIFGMTEEANDNESVAKTLLGLQLDGLRVCYTDYNGAAFDGGLFAGDEIIAINNLKAEPKDIERMISQARGSSMQIHYFREHLLRVTTIEVPTLPLQHPGIIKMKKPTEIGNNWLKQSNQ